MPDRMPTKHVILHIPSTLHPSSGIAHTEAQTLLRRIVWGGVKASLILDSTTAARTIDLQLFLQSLNAPSEVASIFVNATTASLALRSLIQQSGVPLEATCIVIGESHLEPFRSICPAACQVLSLMSTTDSGLAHQQQRQQQQRHQPQSRGQIAHISSQQALLRTIVASHADDGCCFVIGYVMKTSRSLSLAERGFFPLVAADGLCFLPLDLQQDLESQGPFNALLHKASDELVMGKVGSPCFSPAFSAAVEYQLRHPSMPWIDALSDLQKVLDRQTLMAILQSIPQLMPGSTVRPPTQTMVIQPSDWNTVSSSMATAGLKLPCIVKPAVACGISEAHAMTIVMREGGFTDVQSLLPACVQEYVDHGASLYKVYVIGSEVHVAQKKSLPDLGKIANITALPAAIPFDSLAGTLPPHLEIAVADDTGSRLQHVLNRTLIDRAAEWLHQALGLRLFGFDVVVQQSSGDHIIVDVNYFPSFKEVPDAPAKLRIALLQALAEAGKAVD